MNFMKKYIPKHNFISILHKDTSQHMILQVFYKKYIPQYDFKRIELNKGGKVISISDYLKQKEDIPIKKIDLASYFTPGKTLSSLTEAERDVVNQLLRMSLGKKD